MRGRTAALICGNFRRELEMAVEFEKLDGVEIAAFPAECNKLHGEHCTSICNSLNAPKKEYGGIHVFQGGCVPGLERRGLNCGNCFRHVEAICFYMFAEKAAVDALVKNGAYLLTPGWLGKWKYHLAGWGMDRSVAREFFAETARKLVLLDTLADPGVPGHLSELSDFVRLPSESIPVGLDFFRGYIRARLG